MLYTSGYTQNAIVHNGRLDDDVFLLTKPYRKDDLARKLRSLLGTPRAGRTCLDLRIPPNATPARRAGKCSSWTTRCSCA